jgi:hypothetical protein
MPIPFEKNPKFFKRHPTGITIRDAMNMYEWLLELKKIKKGGSAHKRLKELRELYSTGLKHFPKKAFKRK